MFADVFLLEDFELIVLEIRCSWDVSVMYLKVNQAEGYVRVSEAMTLELFRFCMTCWIQRPLNVSLKCSTMEHEVELLGLDVPFYSCDLTWFCRVTRWRYFEFHAQLPALQAMVTVATVGIHRCPFQGLTKVAMLAADRKIVETKASPWHFQIYEHQTGSQSVLLASLLQPVRSEFHHATMRWCYSQSVLMERPSFHHCLLHLLLLVVPARVVALMPILLKTIKRNCWVLSNQKLFYPFFHASTK